MYRSEIVAQYRTHDLCLLSNPTDHAGLVLASSSRNGENIYILGHPLLEPKALVKGEIAGQMTVQIQVIDPVCQGPGFHKLDLTGSFIGALLGTDILCIRDFDSQAVTANILPGNSGSPVLNKYGNVVGVAFAGREGSGRGYIISLETVRDFLSRF